MDRLERLDAGRTGDMSSTWGSEVVEATIVEFLKAPFSLEKKNIIINHRLNHCIVEFLMKVPSTNKLDYGEGVEEKIFYRVTSYTI